NTIPKYRRQTVATLLELQSKLNQFDFILRIRAEDYDISGTTRSSLNATEEKLHPFKKFRLFPNASIQYNFMNQVYLAFNYNKKISLPGISSLKDRKSVV